MKLYNTLNNAKEEFIPLDSNCVKMYVCGPTVYDEIHVGNARSVLVFDLLYRVLKRKYKEVIYVRNITDIDDKIIKRANEEGITASEVARKYEEVFKENYRKLNALEPTHQPRATDTMKEIIESIGELVEQDYAYIQDGHVLFKVDSIEAYGALSKQSNVMEGARVAIGEYKSDSRDFILWKPSKLHEPYWNSPWGKGRPGWHIECTAMSAKFLGERFDIHAGGQDLIFPHHENEQAQNVGLYGKFAGPRYWVHNAMVLFDNQKMSKSLGNIVRISQALAKYDSLVLRFFMLSTHYRHSLMWTDDNIKQAETRYKRWLYHLQEYAASVNEVELVEEIYYELLNDLNAVEAFAVFEEKLSLALQNNDKQLLQKLANTLHFLGLIKQHQEDANLIAQLEGKLEERNTARESKDYALADKLRQEIQDAGYEIVDSKDGSSLKKLI